jgi:hypothetical protein
VPLGLSRRSGQAAIDQRARTLLGLRRRNHDRPRRGAASGLRLGADRTVGTDAIDIHHRSSATGNHDGRSGSRSHQGGAAAEFGTRFAAGTLRCSGTAAGSLGHSGRGPTAVARAGPGTSG